MASSTERLQILYTTYKEDKAYQADDSEPSSRSENIIFHAEGGLKWHVRVAFNAKTGITTTDNLLKRRKELEALICLIDFRSLPLLPDTVSEVVIERAGESLCSQTLPMKEGSVGSTELDSGTCWVYTIHEDASRVQYPAYDVEYSGFPTMALSSISEKEELSNNVFLINYTGNGRNEPFIYKTVDHFFYEPGYTTETFLQELRNYMLLQGSRNIVQLVAEVKGPSPFKTNPLSEGVDVVHGMVLEYYPNGTLREAIERSKDGKERTAAWKNWPYQLACALLRIHELSLTHMDIASRNVVIDAADEAVFIDIGVGYTYENLAPEIRNDSSFMNMQCTALEVPFEQRCRNDWWAFGKLLVEMAVIEEDGAAGSIIRDIGEGLMRGCPDDRLDVSEAIQQLQVLISN